MQTMAQGWLALDLTNTAFLVGLVVSAGSLPVVLFSMHAGVLVDRHERLRLVKICQALLLLEAGLLFALTLSGHISIVWLWCWRRPGNGELGGDTTRHSSSSSCGDARTAEATPPVAVQSRAHRGGPGGRRGDGQLGIAWRSASRAALPGGARELFSWPAAMARATLLRPWEGIQRASRICGTPIVTAP